MSPLARYGHLDVLATLSDLSAPRRRPVWVILPQLRGQIGALVDRATGRAGYPQLRFCPQIGLRTRLTTIDVGGTRYH